VGIFLRGVGVTTEVRVALGMIRRAREKRTEKRDRIRKIQTKKVQKKKLICAMVLLLLHTIMTVLLIEAKSGTR
jgi:uncharacterized membrane protein YidH (DUF202 family)